MNSKDLSQDTIDMVNDVICSGVREAADAIHFNLGKDGLLVTYRKFGKLIPYRDFPKEATRPIIDCVKRMSCLDLNEHFLPQDGRIRITVDGKDIDMLESVMPTRYGEKVVLRLVASTAAFDSLESLGMGEEAVQITKGALEKRRGLTLFCGLRQSGLTTSIHAVARQVTSGTTNACLITSDPVADASNLLYVRPAPWKGLTNAASFRSVLRADMDAILVQEIDCYETAEVVIKAAQRGHFIVGGLAAKDCHSAIQRLLDMGIKATWLTDSLNLIVAQALAPKKCPECSGEGCPDCSETGVIGWTPYFELLPINPSIRRALRAKDPMASLQRYFVTSAHLTLEKQIEQL